MIEVAFTANIFYHSRFQNLLLQQGYFLIQSIGKILNSVIKPAS